MPKIKTTTKSKRSVFAALAEVEAKEAAKPAFAFAPSVLARAYLDETTKFHRDLEIPDGMTEEDLAFLRDPEPPKPALAAASTAAVAPADAGGAAAASVAGVGASTAPAHFGLLSGGLSLADVADELETNFKHLPERVPDAAWDFSSLAHTTTVTTVQIEEDARAKARAEEEKAASAARLLKVHFSDKDKLNEKLHVLQLSHNQRVRRIATAMRGKEHAARMSTKHVRLESKTKLRNKVKHS